MIDRHWDGIAAYCQPENKVSLGFVEGVNNKLLFYVDRDDHVDVWRAACASRRAEVDAGTGKLTLTLL